MQIDMHFYGIYALCRAAGLYPVPSRKIAHASQYVDDAVADESMIFRKSQIALRPLMTSHKPLDYLNTIRADQWQVWAAFHFLPGNQPLGGLFERRMICRKNSELAQKLMECALDNSGLPHGLYQVGVASHSFADTFAHFGFIGINSTWNKVKENSIHLYPKDKTVEKYIKEYFSKFMNRIKGKVAQLVPVGHGSVATYPDYPYLKWEYRYEKDRKANVHRNNVDDFLEACCLLHAYYVEVLKRNPQYGDPATSQEWEKIKKHITSILWKEATKEKRVSSWKRAINSGKLFPNIPSDKKLKYKSKAWLIPKKVQKSIPESEINDLPLVNFFRAARLQIELVVNYMEENNLIVSEEMLEYKSF